MTDHSAVYIGTAFVAGVCVAIACKDLLNRPRREKSTAETPRNGLVARSGPPAIVEGIEGCIGNTPLFRIKSLSDETGCEILAKAEVCALKCFALEQKADRQSDNCSQFLNGAGQSSKDRVALSMIEMVWLMPVLMRLMHSLQFDLIDLNPGRGTRYPDTPFG